MRSDQRATFIQALGILPGVGFNTLGIQPTIQYRIGDHWVGAAGVLFSVAGQNTLAAIYPNFSIYYYWSRTGKVIMR
ncbi:hypothetical protein [Candidatus Nitrospira bockiana]